MKKSKHRFETHQSSFRSSNSNSRIFYLGFPPEKSLHTSLFNHPPTDPLNRGLSEKNNINMKRNPEMLSATCSLFEIPLRHRRGVADRMNAFSQALQGPNAGSNTGSWKNSRRGREGVRGRGVCVLKIISLKFARWFISEDVCIPSIARAFQVPLVNRVSTALTTIGLCCPSRALVVYTDFAKIQRLHREQVYQPGVRFIYYHPLFISFLLVYFLPPLSVFASEPDRLAAI